MKNNIETTLKKLDSIINEGKTYKDQEISSKGRWKDFGGKAGPMKNKKDKSKERSKRKDEERKAKKGVYEEDYQIVPDIDFESFYKLIGEAGKCTGPTKKASSTAKGKKWMQCVKNPDGKGYKRVHWGQKGVKVTGKSGDTKRKKSFRARHGCSSAKPGTAKYQACKDW